ncbi:MAG TPA: protein kinase [Pirellulales bacterium]|nr:protein kinase [Pirellulales bacterium]
MANTREKRAAAARELFASLSLPSWREIAITRPQGGHAGTVVVERSDGARGVFRCLPTNAEPILVERFHRELRILAELRHPNVMELLDCTASEACWYISRLGEPFNLYWERRREALIDAPEDAVSEAVQLLRSVAAGLAECHARGIVHRDIKPQNLVVMNDGVAVTPVLIDFGVAHVDDEQRITPLDEAVGNTRYSPSRMQWRLETVSSWFDIFEVCQVMLWMLQAELPAKHYWQRPVDWRFVRFDERLPPRTIQKLQAIAAQCNAEELSPKDGRALVELIGLYFPRKTPPTPANPTINGEGILSGLADAAAIDALRKEEDRRVIESAYPAAVAFAEIVRDSIWGLVRRLEVELPQCTIRNKKDGDFGSGREPLLTDTKQSSAQILEFWIEAAGRPHRGFAVRMFVQLNRPSSAGWAQLNKGANPFVFTLGVSSLRAPVNLDIDAILTLHSDGRIVLRETRRWDRPHDQQRIPAEGIPVSVHDIAERLAAWCVDPDIWEIVGREYA